MKKIVILALVCIFATSNLSAVDLKGSGASFPYSVYQEWIKAYSQYSGIKIDYISKGSGKGIKDAKARAVDFAGTDKPLSPRVLKKNGLYQFPSVIGAIVMGYNIPNVKNLRLSRATIPEIALGHIKYWDNKLIADANPNKNLPHKKLIFIHRTDASGTTFNFTYYLSKINSQWRHNFGAKKLLSWPGEQHIGGKNNTAISSLIKQTPYSIGYLDYADASNNSISMATVENQEGYYIKAQLSSFQAGANKANLNPQKDFYSIIADPNGSESYPMLAATFILVPKEHKDIDKKVTSFYDWSYKNAKDIAKKLGYVPLPASLIHKIKLYWEIKDIK